MEDKDIWVLKFRECEASIKLITEIERIFIETGERVDLWEIKKAIYYAKKYHGSQVRQSGEPYYHHTVEVAYMIAKYRFTTEVLITSILHDTLEDTKLTFDMIYALFGEIVAKQVQDLTRIKINGIKITAAETLLLSHAKKDIVAIKLCDRLHNMRTIGAKSPEKARKIAIETLLYFVPFAAFLAMRDVEKELTDICHRLLKKTTKPNAKSLLQIGIFK